MRHWFPLRSSVGQTRMPFRSALAAERQRLLPRGRDLIGSRLQRARRTGVNYRRGIRARCRQSNCLTRQGSQGRHRTSSLEKVAYVSLVFIGRKYSRGRRLAGGVLGLAHDSHRNHTIVMRSIAESLAVCESPAVSNVRCRNAVMRSSSIAPGERSRPCALAPLR
jgi:hypothetical protein